MPMSVIAPILADHANATRRVFAVGRAKTVGASEIGACARNVWWRKHNAPHDAGFVDEWGARVRGSVFEDAFWVPALRRRYGDKILFAGNAQRSLSSGYLSATPDGLIIDQPRDALASLNVADLGEGACFLVECKTADPRAHIDKERAAHNFQVQVQLGTIRQLTKFRPEFAVISYTDASFWHEIKEFAVQFDEAVFRSAIVRAEKIMTTPSAFDLPPEGWIAGGSECAYCPFAQACGRQRMDVPAQQKTASPELIAEARALAREFKLRDAEADEANAKLKEARLALTERLRADGVNHIKTEGFSVFWSSVRGRESVDVKALREAASKAEIDISQFISSSERSDRLTVRLEEQPNSG
jgi:CRISPR/Cas system-associated exonuclease Cas4 (RecB family)